MYRFFAILLGTAAVADSPLPSNSWNYFPQHKQLPSMNLQNRLGGASQIEEATRLLSSWLEQVPYLPKPDDAFLRKFYCRCKYSLERTKQVLELYYSVRRGIPDFFADRDPTNDEMRNIRATWYLFSLPNKSPSGEEILVSRFRNPNLHWTAESYAKYTAMTLDIGLQEEDDYHGTVVLYDLQYYTMGTISMWTPTFLKKYILALQDALPIRPREIHFLNAPRYAEVLLTMVKPLLKEKIYKRVMVHSTMESLYKHLPKDILPKEYGGNAGSLEEMNESWEKKLVSYKDYFRSKEEELKNLPERPPRLRIENEMLGMQGSFRKIAID